MTEAFAKQIETEARQAMTELVAAAKLKKGDVLDRKSTRLNSSHRSQSRMPSSA